MSKPINADYCYFLNICRKGTVKALKSAYDMGYDADIKGPFGQTPLMAVCYHGDVLAAEKLVDIGANVNAEDDKGNTPVLYAAHKNHSDVFGVLAKSGANMDHANKEGHTALMVASSKSSCEAMKALVQSGADVDYEDGCGNTALVKALKEDNGRLTARTRLLIDLGASIDCTTRQGKNALSVASEQSKNHALSYMLRTHKNMSIAAMGELLDRSESRAKRAKKTFVRCARKRAQVAAILMGIHPSYVCGN